MSRAVALRFVEEANDCVLVASDIGSQLPLAILRLPPDHTVEARDSAAKSTAAPPRRAAMASLATYPRAFFTRSSVNGACRKRTPVSAIMAFDTAGVINGVAICPTPVGGLSVWITSTCIGGTSLLRDTM